MTPHPGSVLTAFLTAGEDDDLLNAAMDELDEMDREALIGMILYQVGFISEAMKALCDMQGGDMPETLQFLGGLTSNGNWE